MLVKKKRSVLIDPALYNPCQRDRDRRKKDAGT